MSRTVAIIAAVAASCRSASAVALPAEVGVCVKRTGVMCTDDKTCTRTRDNTRCNTTNGASGECICTKGFCSYGGYCSNTCGNTTDGTCKLGRCNAWRGSTVCTAGKCDCKADACMVTVKQAVTGVGGTRTVQECKDKCASLGDASCNIWACKANRGPTICQGSFLDKRCMCQKGYCAIPSGKNKELQCVWGGVNATEAPYAGFWGMPNFFVDSAKMGPAQLFWAFVSYGYVLGLGANMIGDGSELLMLVPSIAGIVGSIVVPILGAVPDGMMVLFSGMKPQLTAAQEQVTVGIGALAGSTIMLLTATSFVAIVGGRVDIKEGKCAYNKRPKLTDGGLFDSGVEISGAVKTNAKIMLLTTCSFLVIQIPALLVDKNLPTATAGETTIANAQIGPESSHEHMYALIGLFLCVAEFIGYCALQYWQNSKSQGDDSPDKCLSRRATDLTGLVAENGIMMYIEEYKQKLLAAGQRNTDTFEGAELHPVAKEALKNFFNKYAGSDKVIDKDEFAGVLRDINCAFDIKQLENLFNMVDTDKSGKINQDEFLNGFQLFVRESKPVSKSIVETEDADEEEDDMPEEWAELSPQEQQKRILMRSCKMMALGSLLVLFFSDPMVDVMSSMGTLTGIPPFFVAFILAPVASNASELISTYKFATKKTQSSITTSMSTVIGAACMNNTYCLGIFFGLVYFQGLAWRFTAETSSMVVVLVIMGIVALTKKQLTLFEGLLILSLYPLSLLIVLGMEHFGFD